MVQCSDILFRIQTAQIKMLKHILRTSYDALSKIWENGKHNWILIVTWFLTFMNVAIELKDAASYLRYTREFMVLELQIKNGKYMRISFMTSNIYNTYTMVHKIQQFPIKTFAESSVRSWGSVWSL